MSTRVRSHFLRTSNRALPVQENPLGVPRSVMKALMAEQLPSDVDVFNAKLQELLNHQKG
jgi:hypothetical protein